MKVVSAVASLLVGLLAVAVAGPGRKRTPRMAARNQENLWIHGTALMPKIGSLEGIVPMTGGTSKVELVMINHTPLYEERGLVNEIGLIAGFCMGDDLMVPGTTIHCTLTLELECGNILMGGAGLVAQPVDYIVQGGTGCYEGATGSIKNFRDRTNNDPFLFGYRLDLNV